MIIKSHIYLAKILFVFVLLVNPALSEDNIPKLIIEEYKIGVNPLKLGTDLILDSTFLSKREYWRKIKAQYGHTVRSINSFDPDPVIINSQKYTVEWKETSYSKDNIARPKYLVKENNETIYEFYPVIGITYAIKSFYPWKDKWILEYGELDDITHVVVSGEDLNLKYDYSKSFFYRIIKDKPIYFFEKDNIVKISFDDKTVLNYTYEKVVHDRCCELTIFNPRNSDNMICFYAFKNGEWYYVEAGVFE